MKTMNNASAGMSISDQVFRRSSSFELLSLLDSDFEIISALSDLDKNPEFSGLLMSKCNRQHMRALDRMTYKLWHELELPSYLPKSVSSKPWANSWLSRLVADGLLEVENNGIFITGSNFLETYPIINNSLINQVDSLSLAALNYANRLPLSNPFELGARLYFYNRRPPSPSLVKELRDRTSVWNYLRLNNLSSQGWYANIADFTNDGWIYINSSRTATKGSHKAKLYISVEIEALPYILPKILNSIKRDRILTLKLGGNMQGLLRPDNFVVYLSDIDDINQVSGDVSKAITGAPTRGVPFTAPVKQDISNSDGLSWGIDPPRSDFVQSWQKHENSWRAWVTRKLGQFILQARWSGHPDPIRFALARIQLDGVSPSGWTPLSPVTT